MVEKLLTTQQALERVPFGRTWLDERIKGGTSIPLYFYSLVNFLKNPSKICFPKMFPFCGLLWSAPYG